jgi:hypothetical protein
MARFNQVPPSAPEENVELLIDTDHIEDEEPPPPQPPSPTRTSPLPLLSPSSPRKEFDPSSLVLESAQARRLRNSEDRSPSRPSASPVQGQQRVSSFAKKGADGTPRTPNRVRFDFDDNSSPFDAPSSHQPRAPIVLGWRSDDNGHDDDEGDSNHAVARGGDTQRVPLLTDIEAPSITVALADDDFNPEDLLESSRPKSGMRSAFMNMANSIM